MANTRPKKARSWGFQGKRAFFGLGLAITRKIRKIGIQKYTFLKSAWNSASIELLHETFWRSSKIFIFSRCRKWQVAAGDPRRPQKILKKNQNDFHRNGTLSPEGQDLLGKKRYYGTPYYAYMNSTPAHTQKYTYYNWVRRVYFFFHFSTFAIWSRTDCVVLAPLPPPHPACCIICRSSRIRNQ